MSYLDLPDDWMNRPMDNPQLSCNVADFLLSDHDRVTNTLMLVRCGSDLRLTKRPILISHVNWQASDLKRKRSLERFFRFRPAALFMALSSEERLPRAIELAWSITVEDLCQTYNITLLGVHSLCRQGNFSIDLPRPLPAPNQIRRAIITA